MYIKTFQKKGKIIFSIEQPNQPTIIIEQEIESVQSSKRTVLKIDAPKTVKITIPD